MSFYNWSGRYRMMTYYSVCRWRYIGRPSFSYSPHRSPSRLKCKVGTKWQRHLKKTGALFKRGYRKKTTFQCTRIPRMANSFSSLYLEAGRISNEVIIIVVRRNVQFILNNHLSGSRVPNLPYAYFTVSLLPDYGGFLI